MVLEQATTRTHAHGHTAEHSTYDTDGLYVRTSLMCPVFVLAIRHYKDQ